MDRRAAQRVQPHRRAARPAVARITPAQDPILTMQRLAGNAATTGLLHAQAGASYVTVQRDFDPLETSDESARSLLKSVLFDWAMAKETFLVNPKTDDERATGERKMSMLVRYRKRYVDKRLLELKARYPGLRTKSVGSLNVTSDYDITLSGPGDVDAMEEFNAKFRAEWGKESGTVFDTNLYAKDFLPVRSNVAYPLGAKQIAEFKGVEARKWTPDEKGGWAPSGPRRIEREAPERGLEQPSGAGAAEHAGADQDVYALVKQRKYMTLDEWARYVEGVTAKLPPTKRAEARKRYERADALFAAYVAELLAKLDQDGATLDRTLPPNEQLAELEHKTGDAVTRARNKIYVAKVREVRRLQARYEQLKAKPGDHVAELDNLAVTIKEMVGRATVFAIEAYHTEGAVLDVVGGQQGGQQLSLGVDQYLQSYNEQLGDFLKDLVHYEAAGEAFYRSAKYLRRLVLAARQIVQMTGGKLEGAESTTLAHLEAMGDPDKPLLQIRSLHANYRTRSEAEKQQLAVDYVKDLIGLATKDELKAKVLALSETINALVRQVGARPAPLVPTTPSWRELVGSTG